MLLSLLLSGTLLIASFRGLSGSGPIQTIIPELSVAFVLIGVAIFSAWSAVRGINSATEFAAEELGTNTVADAFKEHRFLEPIEELALSLRNRGSTSGEHKLRVLTELDDGISGESEK